jgi:hypothetical protein
VLQYPTMIIKAVLLFLLIASPAIAADHAIRIGCPNNGDGTTWACAAGAGATGAFNTLPATLTRDDTYYISEGTITLDFYHPDDAADGTKYITIKKAVAAAHGPSTGWSDSLGDTQTVFKGGTQAGTPTNVILYLASGTEGGYYKFDGVTGSGSDASTYGFKFTYTDTNPGYDSNLIYGNAAPPNMQFLHVAFVGDSGITGYDQKMMTDGGANWLFQYCLFDKFTNSVYQIGAGTVVDSCYFSNQLQYGDFHGQSVEANASNITVKNSSFIHSANTGAITSNSCSPAGPRDGWLIYNNVFVIGGSGILLGEADGCGIGFTNMGFYNNTIVDSNGMIRCQTSAGGTCSGILVKNNIYHNSSVSLDDATYSNGNAHTYNFWDASCTGKPSAGTGDVTATITAANLFTSPATGDYTLKDVVSTIGAGTNLGAVFTIDKNGLTRSAWSKGAYEYTSGTTTYLPFRIP